MRKSKFMLLTLSAFGVVSLVSSVVVNNLSMTLAYEDSSSCLWNHYSQLDASLEDNGVKEYWVCCTHHDFSLSKPANGTFVEKGKPETAFANSLSSNDARLIPSYRNCVNEFDEKVHSLYESGSLDFSSCWSLNELRQTYEGLGSYQSEAKRESELTYLENKFASSYELLIKGDELSFKNREYGSTAYDLSYLKNEVGMGESKLTSIKGNDTFWIYPDSSLPLSNYSKVYLYVRAEASISLQFRAKTNYSASATYSLEKGVWTAIEIDLSDVDLLSDIGFAIWKGTSFSLDYSLEFSSIYGEKKTKTEDVKLFDASTDAWTNNDYPLEYTLTHIEDEDKGSLVKMSDMSSAKEWIWLKPAISKSVSSFTHVYFDFMIDQDTSIDFKETYDGAGTCYQKLSMTANTWYRVLIPVNSSTFPSGNLTDLGLGKWSASGTHDASSSGNWYMSSIYGVVDVSKDGYEAIDGKWVPVYSSDDFDITAYAMCPLTSSNADTVLKDAKDAGFSKITTLYDGRNGTAETTFVTALKDYCSTLIINKSQKLETLLSSVDSFCDAIKDSNVYNIQKANEYGIKTTSLVSILYDLDSFASSSDITISDDLRVKIAERVYAKLDYTGEEGYDGLFLKDEPSVKNDLTLYKSLIQSYQNAGLKGTPYMNLLPLGDDGSESNYSTYLDNYFNNVYPLVNYASFDQYPMGLSGKTTTRHLRNLADFASRIKNSATKGKLKTFIHSTLSDDSNNDIAGISSSDDLLFQMNANLAFGSKDISYFVYSSNSNKEDGLVNYSTGAKTSLYGYAKEANANVLSFANAFSYFDYSGVATYSSSTCAQFDAISSKLSSLADLTLSSFTSPTLVSEFSKGNQNAYFIMNYANPQNSSSVSDQVTFSVDSKYNYVLAYSNGSKSLVPTSGGVSLTLDKGSSAFVIPLSL